MNLEKIKEQIKKITALANDEGATEEEAENALRFARRLMLKNNLKPEDLEEAKGGDEIAADADAVEYGTSKASSQSRNLAQWETNLSYAVAELIGTVQCYRMSAQQVKTSTGSLVFNSRNGKPKVATPVVFYGPEEDCQDAVELFNEWSHVIASLARLKYGEAMKGDGRCYAEGFTRGLQEKVNKIRKEETEISQKDRALLAGSDRCTALMVVNATAVMDAKKARGSEYLRKELNIKLSTRSRSRSYRHFNGDAFGAGKADGSRADFNRTRKPKLTG